MEQLHRDLEEMRSSVEALTEECRAKSLLSERLRRSHDEQLARFQEAKTEIAKQAKEIDAKAEEIAMTKQMCEDLESSLHKKEAVVKNLSSANEKLRTSFTEKVAKLEEENKKVILALDEANAVRDEQDRKIRAHKGEIDGLKLLLSKSQKKCLDAEQRAQALKEVKRRDEMLLELEKEKGEVEEQLKWKNERFRHLEDAHHKIQEEYRGCKKEWNTERSKLVDEVSKLQMDLDLQTRVVEELRSQLQMCNQALAHEESRRKVLETQMSESKALYENVMLDYEEARSSIESLTARRDEEVAALRNSLSTKATFVKELEYIRSHLEQENEELRSSLKELQEAQISKEDAASSFKTLRGKFRALEQAHKGCSEKLKVKDMEWRAAIEKLSNQLDECQFKLICKERELCELQAELEGSYSLITLQTLENEELSVVLIVVKSKFLESCSKVEELEHEMKLYWEQLEERTALLMDQLEEKDRALVRAQAKIKQEHEMADLSLARFEHLESIEKEYFLLQKELARNKVLVEELSMNLDCSKKQAACKENELQEGVRKASDAPVQENAALAEKNCELNNVQFELQQLKYVVESSEKMRNDLKLEMNKYHDESISIRKDLENVLLAKLEAEEALREEKESFLQMLEEKDKTIEELQQHIVLLKEEKQESDSALAEIQKSSAKEKKKFLHIVEDVESRVNCIKEEFEHHIIVLKEDKRKSDYALAKVEKSRDQENKKFLLVVEDVERRLNRIKEELELLEQNYVQREIEILVNVEGEKARFLQVLEENESAIAEFRQHILSYEETTATKLKDTDLQIRALREALEKTETAHIMHQQEIEYRNLLIGEMQEEICALQLKLEFEENQSFGLKNYIHQLEVNSAADLLEKEKEMVNVENQLKGLLDNKMTLEGQVEQFYADKKALTETIVRLSSEREEFAGQIVGLGDLIENVSSKGEEVMRKWFSVVKNVTNEDDTLVNFEVGNLFSSKKLDERNCTSPSRNKAGQVPDMRLPLKENNC